MKHWKSLNQTKPAAKCRCVTQAKVPMLVFYHFSTSIPCLKPVPSFKNKIKKLKKKTIKGMIPANYQKPLILKCVYK